MPKVCQDMHKCDNYHAILHKLYRPTCGLAKTNLGYT